MIIYKLLLILNEGLIFGILTIGIFVAFQWLRFPDLTPDGSFILGASIYVKMTTLGINPIIGLKCSFLAGMAAGSLTAIINKLIGVPAVVAGLIVSSSLYSITWLILGKPNQFLDPSYTLVGNISGIQNAQEFMLWLILLALIVLTSLSIFSETIWGIKIRAIGDNPLLAKDLNTFETWYVVCGLALCNGLVAFSGALFTQRSFFADINMGIGVTISGLAGMVLGLLIKGKHRKTIFILISVILGSIIHKAVIFFTLEVGVPAESFRLLSTAFLLLVFILFRQSTIDFLKGLRWN